jgi:hypothetical protein
VVAAALVAAAVPAVFSRATAAMAAVVAPGLATEGVVVSVAALEHPSP